MYGSGVRGTLVLVVDLIGPSHLEPSFHLVGERSSEVPRQSSVSHLLSRGESDSICVPDVSC